MEQKKKKKKKKKKKRKKKERARRRASLYLVGIAVKVVVSRGHVLCRARLQQSEQG